MLKTKKLHYVRAFEKTYGNSVGNSLTNRVFHSFLNNNEDKGKELHMKLYSFFKTGAKGINKEKLRRNASKQILGIF